MDMFRAAVNPVRRLVVVLALVSVSHFSSAAAQSDDDLGESVYRYYCYQCHGYSGNGRTQAGAYLEPPPRDFTAASSRNLTVASMMNAINLGRPGTAMPAFDDVLDDAEIEAVAGYIEHHFISMGNAGERYHSVANGWSDFGRHEAAVPFVEGAIRVEAPADSLSPAQLRGKSLYLESCISCHEQSQKDGDGAVWELRAVSYPRRHYSHREGPLDALTAASPYAVHDAPAEPGDAGRQAPEGFRLFQENCAFCHAADGSGQNWIGSFLEPRPRNLRAASVSATLADAARLRRVIRNGLNGTSMPAWRDVLSDEQIDAIISYLQEAFAEPSSE